MVFPAVIKVKVLLQRLWEEGISWDDPAPHFVQDVWQKWRMELPILLTKAVPRCYFPMHLQVASKSLHGFSDASEDAYAAVVYLRIVGSDGKVHISLVTSKTKVAPIKRLSIPRLELCGALLLSRLLAHAKMVLNIPTSDITAWTDSTVVLSWLVGNPRRFKTYVGNRIAQIASQVPCKQWRHVAGVENPADCASRGLYPSDLVQHPLWWNGSKWLTLPSSSWPAQFSPTADNLEHSDEVISHATVEVSIPKVHCVVSLDHYSSFEHLKRVVSWIIRFVKNCKFDRFNRIMSPLLTTPELHYATNYLCRIVQAEHFPEEIKCIKSDRPLPKGNCLLPFSPIMDANDLLRVGG